VERGAGAGVKRCALLAAATLAAACASRRPAPEVLDPPLDCAAARDGAVRACVEGFRAEVPVGEERPVELEFAVRGVCPYAGAVAWSGCRRGAFERFRGRSVLGRCGDEVDYVETSILTSCMRRAELPLDVWNALVARCFAWAEAGTARLWAACDARGGSAAAAY
jgi:hypothetical protein